MSSDKLLETLAFFVLVTIFPIGCALMSSFFLAFIVGYTSFSSAMASGCLSSFIMIMFLARIYFNQKKLEREEYLAEFKKNRR